MKNTLKKVVKTVGEKSATRAFTGLRRCFPLESYQPALPSKLMEKVKNEK